MLYKKCMWLMRGKATTCPRGAAGKYCAQHNYQIRGGALPFTPCRRCGVGCRVDFQLCKACGGGTLRICLLRIERRARKAFAAVMSELLATTI